MSVVEVSHVTKAFADKVVVDDLSFSVNPGEIFGLIGPNGAGKTTTIRMMMDIIKPDSGDVSILGEALSENAKNKIGYMPEEKGLYKKLRISETISYLATLKGMDRNSAAEKADILLERTGMLDTKRKKVNEMSRGMGQIIQFITTIIHDPQLIVLDEPFSGLDPVNTELMREMFIELRDQGKAVILSTHQMNQVEELCDRILMINHGKAVLYGRLRDIKAKYSGNSIIVDYTGDFGKVPGVTEIQTHDDYSELVLDGTVAPKEILSHLVNRNILLERFEAAVPSLHEIFLMEAGENSE